MLPEATASWSCCWTCVVSRLKTRLKSIVPVRYCCNPSLVASVAAWTLRSRSSACSRDLKNPRSVQAATEATKLGLQQYRTGTIDFNRVFNLETTQVQQQDQLAVASGNIALNLVNVYRALGGGWELRYQQEAMKHETAPSHGDARGAPREAPAAPGPGSLPEPLPAPRP